MNEANFNDIDCKLREELTDLIAKERGLDRSNRLYRECREAAALLVSEYRRRGPFTPTTQIEEVLVRVGDNERARCAHREEVAAMRAKQVAEVLAQVPEPEPDVVRIIVRDERTGRPVRLSLPAKQVEWRWE